MNIRKCLILSTNNSNYWRRTIQISSKLFPTRDRINRTAYSEYYFTYSIDGRQLNNNKEVPSCLLFLSSFVRQYCY